MRKCYSRGSWLEIRWLRKQSQGMSALSTAAYSVVLFQGGNHCTTATTIFTYLSYLLLRCFCFCLSPWNTHFSLLSASSPILLKTRARSHPPPLCRKYDPKEEDPSSVQVQECHGLQSSRGSEASSLDQGCSKELRSSSAAPGSCWAASHPPSTEISALLYRLALLFLWLLESNSFVAITGSKGEKINKRGYWLKGLLMLRH